MRKLAPILLIILALNAKAQIPNSDFENWTVDPVLVDWQTNSAPLTLPPYDPYTVRQSMDSYSGTYCADLFTNGVFKPYMETTFPVSAHPEKLTFWWKSVFAPCVNDANFPEHDTLAVLVQLLDNGSVVDSGNWSYTGPSTFNYQEADVLFTNLATQFDSCRIRFDGGAIVGGCGIVIQATEFYVDEANISYFPNSLERLEHKISLHPNPASTYLRLDDSQMVGGSRQFQIVDNSGRLVITGAVDRGDFLIDIQHLIAGSYVLLIKSEKEVVARGRFMVR